MTLDALFVDGLGGAGDEKGERREPNVGVMGCGDGGDGAEAVELDEVAVGHGVNMLRMNTSAQRPRPQQMASARRRRGGGNWIFITFQIRG